MPELPEVETVSRALANVIVGHCFTEITCHIPSLRLPLELHNIPALIDNRIEAVRRRARYIIIEFASLDVIIIHLGMSGSMRSAPNDEARNKHEHIIFTLDDGRTVRFDCPRRFGFAIASHISAAGADPDELSHLGPEPLTRSFSAPYFAEQIAGRTAAIKTILMDNRIVVGVGNIYCNEALYAAGIRPDREAGTLSSEEIALLVREVKKVLRKAIKAGGTTIVDFKGMDGSEGRFHQQLRIYGKDGTPCQRCREQIDKSRIGGRSSYFCPKCQT